VIAVPYLPTVVLAAAGLLLLVALVLRTVKALRAFRRTASMVAANTQDRAGLIRARSAGLRLAFAQRRHRSENQ
jgi:hypothetical protein